MAADLGSTEQPLQFWIVNIPHRRVFATRALLQFHKFGDQPLAKRGVSFQCFPDIRPEDSVQQDFI